MPSVGNSQAFDFDADEVIGGGKLGAVFIGANKATREKVAIKVGLDEKSREQLAYEAKVYRDLSRTGLGKIPKLHWHGAMGRSYVLVMDLLGPSLKDVFVGSGQSFSKDLTARLGRDILSGIEFLHSRGFLHRGIRPEHIVFDDGALGRLHLIDFGWAKKFRDKERNHIAMQTKKQLLGDPAFASLNAHLGFQQGRRDDIESVAFVLLYLSAGLLPWNGLEAEDMQRAKESGNLEGKCPVETWLILQHARNLAFEGTPDYSRLRRFLSVAKKRSRKDFGSNPISEGPEEKRI